MQIIVNGDLTKTCVIQKAKIPIILFLWDLMSFPSLLALSQPVTLLDASAEHKLDLRI